MYAISTFKAELPLVSNYHECATVKIPLIMNSITNTGSKHLYFTKATSSYKSTSAKWYEMTTSSFMCSYEL